METTPVQPNQESSFLKRFGGEDDNFIKGVLLPAILIVLIISAGFVTGWFLAKGGVEGVLGTKSEVSVAPGAEVKGEMEEVGLNDAKTFKDSAEGVLEKGGIGGEGTHHLVRDGGPSQYVYLTSSVIDLSGFVGKKVQVWGETNKANKAGWLMDVGRLKVIK